MRLAYLYFVALAALVGCSADPGGFRDSGHPTDGPVSNVCSMAGQIVCSGGMAATCDSSLHPGAGTACSNGCSPGIGCTMCMPNSHSCDASGTPQVCSSDGSGYTAGAPCAAGMTCSATSGTCVSPASLCGDAVASHSYIGCDYWFTSTLNSQLGSYPTNPLDPSSAVGVAGFPFAVAVANPQSSPATVTISGGGLSGMTTMVAAGALSIVQLPWLQPIAQVTQAGHMPANGHSVLAHNSAYHLSSDVPVTIYDFNALSYQDVRHAHCDPTTDLTCFSFTNDASLLLPTSVLTGNYTVLGWPSQTTQYMGSVDPSFGGFATIIGTSATPTNVTIHLTGGVDGSSGVPTAAAGGTITQTLNQGDVLQIVSGAITHCTQSPQPLETDSLGIPVYACQPDAQHDLTGSIITADQPVAVFGGHDCANVPYNHAACDHLEEELFPNETLGSHYVVSYTQPQLSPREPNWVRIMSNHAGNVITFSPASVHASVTLDRGAYIDFLQTEDFEVTGTAAFVTAQFTVGEDYDGTGTTDPTLVGDPAMVLEVATEQWRTSYEFLAPDTYTKSYVNVIAQHGANITLDGAALGASPTTVGAYDVYRIDISSRTGAHHIESTGGEKFGIKVYGFGSYTAYMYPGGLDLNSIAPPG